MAGIITSLPPLIEQPPGNNSSDPAGLPGVTNIPAVPTLPQNWTALQTFQPGTIALAGTGGPSQVLKQTTVNGIVTVGQLSFSDIAGSIGPVQIPPPTPTTLGGVFSEAAVSHQFVTQIGTDGSISQAQPAFADISGSVAATQMPALTGDITTTAGAVATTLATVNSNVGTFGTATAAPQITTNGKGLVTAVSTVTITPAIGSVTGLGTGVGTALAIAVGSAGAPVTNGGALGTPASGVATNLTGTASGLTAGHVTTNANLTGDVTSVGNATTLATGNAGNLNSGTLLAARMPALTGDVTTTAGTVATSLAANAVTNAKLAAMNAFTFKGNNTSGSAAPTDVDISLLTAKTTPASSDLLLISDQGASGAWKKIAISSLPSGGGTPSIVITPESFGAKGDGTSVTNGTITSGSANLTTPQGSSSATVTITNASPSVISWTAHGFAAGQQVTLSTTGALPSPFVASKTYYVIAAGLVTNAFELSATAGGAAINTTTAGSGTHTGHAVAGYSFVAADAGKYIMVAGAGVAGAPLVTTIASVSGGAAVLTTSASTTVASAYTEWGTDDSAALHNMAVASSGTAVWFTAGKLYFYTNAGSNQIRFGGTNFVIYGNGATVRAMANAPNTTTGFMFCDATNVGVGPSDFSVRDLIYDGNRTFRIASGAISNAVGGSPGFFVIGAWHFNFINTRAIRTDSDGHYVGGDTRTGQQSAYFNFLNCYSGDVGRNAFTVDGGQYGSYVGCIAENITFGATKSNISYGWDMEPDGSWNQNNFISFTDCIAINCTSTGFGSNITNGANLGCSASQCTAQACGVGFYESGSGTFKVFAPILLSNTTNFTNITPMGGTITNVLGSDVALSSGSYFDGPSVPLVGPNGTWSVSGSVTLLDTGGSSTLNVKLWDGTTIISSTSAVVPAANIPVQVSLSGSITNPVGNLKISVADVSRTTGVIKFNQSGNSKDSTITVTKQI